MAVIHSRPDVLDQLLLLVASDSRLSGALEEQNGLYQVCPMVIPQCSDLGMLGM